MKTLIVIVTFCLSIKGGFAQTNASKLYCISEMNGKTIVMLNDEIINATIKIDSISQLSPNGVVIWGDRSSTILRTGDCINDSGVVISFRPETDFIGNQNALNHIHMLPEATVTDESITNKSDIINYNAYMARLYKDIEKNDYEISIIKEKLWTMHRKEATKYRKKLNTLDNQNRELKIDYDTFIHFGLLNEWTKFRAEMNGDLKAVVQDITSMKSELF